MSVNVGQRNVQDTQANRQCYAVDACLSLAIHTIKLCSNENVFVPAYARVTESIVALATDMYVNANSANRIHVRTASDWLQRDSMQRSAMLGLDSLIGYINISRRLFHLRRNKAENWTRLTLEAKGLVQKWHEADVSRFGYLIEEDVG